MAIRIMEVEEIRDLLSNFTYKPGWTFYVHDRLTEDRSAIGSLMSIFQPCWISVNVSTQDTYNPENETLITFSNNVPGTAMRSEEEFLNWLRDLLGKIELHERDEWMKINGKMPYDPHGEDPTRFELGRRLEEGQLERLTRSAT